MYGEKIVDRSKYDTVGCQAIQLEEMKKRGDHPDLIKVLSDKYIEELKSKQKNNKLSREDDVILMK